MDAERWERIKDLYEGAAARAPEQRAEFLAGACAGDPEIQAEVARLLRQQEDAERFFGGLPGARPAEPPQTLTDGAFVCGRFKVIRFIGAGGMGEVYEARDELVGVPVALKIVRPEIAADPRTSVRFRREVQMARTVTHPNVCRIHELYFQEKSQILSMELLHGETLAAFLRRHGPMNAREAWPVLRQIASALDAAHRAGVIHRDLKPGNVILAGNGPGTIRAVVTDFGLARGVERNRQDATDTGMGAGTPAYMSPEQLRGEPATFAADLYAFGVMWFETMTGRRPFEGNSPVEVALRQVNGPAPSPRESAPDLDPRWDRAIRRCLERDPQRRFTSAAELLQFLDATAPEGMESPGLAPVVRRRPGAKWKKWAVVFALAVTLLGGILRLSKRTAKVAAGSTVLLTPIRTSDPELEGTTAALRGQLAQSPHFSLMEETRVRELLRQMQRKPDAPMDAATAREVALRDGAPLVVYGTVGSLGQEYVLDMKMEQVQSGPLWPRASWRRQFTAGGKKELLDAIHRAANWIRTMAGEAARDLAEQDRPPEDTTTPSWQALQLFAQAERRDAAGDEEAAVLLYQEAIQADPDFAMAHMRLADVLISLKRYEEGYRSWREAMLLTQKRQLTSRESLRIRGQYYEDTGDWAAAEKAYRTFAVHYPNDYLPLFFLGSILADMDRGEEAAERFKEAAARKPQSYVPPAHLALLYLDQGRAADAEAQIGRVRLLGSKEWAAWLESLAEFTQRRPDRALERTGALEASGDPSWRSWSFTGRADWLSEMGKESEARAALEQGTRFDASRGLLAAEADKELDLAWLFFRIKDRQAMAAACARAIRLDASPERVMRAGTLLARAGLVSDARQLLARLPGDAQIPRLRLMKERLEGEIALAGGRLAEALRRFREAAQLGLPTENREYLARALERSGDLRGALEIYEDVGRHPARIYANPDTQPPGSWAAARDEAARLARQ